MIPLSVLDLAPISSGRTARQALQESLDLARHAEALGYGRLWVAEHHGMPGIASSSPAVLIAALAGATERIRVGSGGVMLPNHAPFVIAEQFGMLEALHPGRIDLGLGRAPGTDQRTASLLRRGDADDFPGELALLRAFFDGPVQGIHAVPAEGNSPQVWLLGSSGFSAQLAGLLGLPFAFAHHFSGENTLPALERYRSSFRPGVLESPYAMVCASVLVADSYEQARRLALPGALSFVRLRQGLPGVFPSMEEAEAHPWTAQERAFAEHRMDGQVIGSPAQVREQLDRLIADTRADELMVTTAAHDPVDRLRSYDLLASLGSAVDGTLTLRRAA
ncbi:MAG: alkanal monooxygenase [Frankiales bacterium]|nr:alkanal monooxygenase [Frankiales bacterium]